LISGFSTIVSFCALDWLPFISSGARAAFLQFFADQPAFAFMTGLSWLALFFVTPTAFALGTIFPAVLQAYALKEGRKDGDFGFLYVSNLVGAIVGCLFGGLFFHSVLSKFTNTPLMHSLVLTCFLFFIFVLLFSNFIKFAKRRFARAASVLGLVLLVLLKPGITDHATLIGLGFSSQDHQNAFLDLRPNAPEDQLEHCLAYREGTNSIVSVIRNSATNTLSLKTDGRMEAALPDDLQWPSPTSDLPTHILLAEIALLLCPLEPQDALLIGYGSGATADTLLDYPALKKLTAVDLAGDVFSFSKYFEHNFLHSKEIDQNQPRRINLVKCDGRNYLSLLKRRYDLIVSQPGEPYLNGMGDLYTKEFWQLGRSRLRNYGLFCQWIQLYGLDREAVLTLCRTFQNVFPHTLVFRAPGAAELILVGFKLPSVTESEATNLTKMARSPKAMKADVSVAVPDISINWNNFVQRFYRCDVQRRLARINVREPLDVITMMRFGQSDLAELLEGTNIEQEAVPAWSSSEKSFNTDDQPIVEFKLPQFLPERTMLQDLIHLFSAVPTRLDTFFFEIGSTKRDTSDLYAELAMKYAEIGKSEPDHKLREEFLTTCAMLARRAYRFDSTDGGLPGRGYVLQTFQSPIPKSLDLLMYGFEPKTSKNVEDCLIIGRFFEIRNLPERAGQCFARALELAPKSERALRFLLNWQLAHQKFEEAIDTSNRAYALDPRSDWALAGRGEARLYSGERASAIEDFRKALHFNPELFQARFLLGKALCVSGEEKSGLKEIYWASLVKPENPEPNLYVTAYYVSTSQWQAARDNLIVLRRKLPQDPRVDNLARKIEEHKTIDKSDLPN
jgi:spermidine synthase/tetratricopeptide (TPR) repeat protein